MQDAKVNSFASQIRNDRILSIAILAFVLVAGIWFVLNARRPQSDVPDATVIPSAVLEEQYGMRVNLIAVTAAGGFVDVRIKILDGEKAKTLLSNPDNFPALRLENGMTLDAPADVKSQAILFDDGGTMFIMYPNSGSLVRQGELVGIVFGDIMVEPTDAR